LKEYVVKGQSLTNSRLAHALILSSLASRLGWTFDSPLSFRNTGEIRTPHLRVDEL